MNVAVVQSEDSQGTASLKRHLPVVRAPVKREAARSVDNLESISLQLHRLPVLARVRCEVEEREGRVPMVNLAGSREAEHLLRLNRGRKNRKVERKKEKGLQRQNRSRLAHFRCCRGVAW